MHGLRDLHSRPNLVWAFVLVLFIGFGARIAIHAYGLPYVVETDEPNMYRVANSSRGLLPPDYRLQWLAGYPPAYFWFSARVMDLTDAIHKLDIYQDMALYIRVLRLTSVCADVLTLALLMALVRWLGSDVAALLAGSVWAISAPIMEHAIAALPDTYAVLLIAACAVFSVRAIRHNKLWLSLLATISGLLAVAFKYPAAPVLFLPAISCLYLIAKHRSRARAVILSTISLILVLATGYWLLIIVGAQGLDNAEAQQARGQTFVNLASLHRWTLTLSDLSRTLGPGLIIIGVLALLATLIRRQQWQHGLLIAGLFLTGLGLLGLVPIYVRGEAVDVTRYTWLASFMFIACAALAIQQAFFNGTRASWRWLSVAIPILWLVPASAAQLANLARPGTFALAQAWFEQNAPDRARVWTGGFASFRVLSRFEGGYRGFKQFDCTDGETETTRDLSVYYDYVMVTDNDIEAGPFTRIWSPLDQLTLIKKFDSETLYGPKVYIYATTPLFNPQETRFEDHSNQLVLHSLKVWEDANQVSVDSFWDAPATPSQDFSFSLRLTPANRPSTILVQRDNPVGNRPTSTWNDPEEMIPGNISSLALPALVPGSYVVTLTVYDWRTGRPLTLDNHKTSLEISQFSIF